MSNYSLIYHYTSFEKLQCILANGTLRFKESTCSNDILDSIGFENILKSMPSFNAPGAESSLLNFIIDYYKQETYTPAAKSLVACFSKIPDSRLLWDAYTMHRPGNLHCIHGEDRFCHDAALKYDGVCVAFRQEQIAELIHSMEGVNCAKANIQPVVYGNSKIKVLLNQWLKEVVQEYTDLAKDNDQTQNIIPPIPLIGNTYITLRKSLVIPAMEFMKKVTAFSPFFKDQFWHEEAEVRAVLFMEASQMQKYNTLKGNDGAYYFDVEFPPECIDHIILGPEFDNNAVSRLNQNPTHKYQLQDFELKASLGTGVIRNQ